ncbi:APLP protein, partial [Chloropsis cyanopogon]|nr:APLP protein [Chloropsis cyanopogon]
MYDLASKCSVLLAKDFVHSAFTVILNEETRNSRSLYVEMNQTVVTIYPQLKISKMYNFSFTEENCQVLDQSLENSTMNSRQGTKKIEVSDQNGVSVSCDFQYDLCTVTLSGWHHGVSAGLFGTNDNEAGNEWMVPNGSFSDNVKEFTQSWQVNKCSLVPKKEKPCPITAKQNICKVFFEEPHSLLR